MGDRFAAHPQGAPRGWATQSTGEFSNGTSGENYSGINTTHFLMKTLPRVASEMALHVLAYNLTRVMNIMGVQPLMAAMRA